MGDFLLRLQLRNRMKTTKCETSQVYTEICIEKQKLIFVFQVSFFAFFDCATHKNAYS